MAGIKKEEGHCVICGYGLTPTVADVLGNGEHKFVSTVRPAQVEIGEVIEEAFNSQSNALCEAGTGTGKSWAYLVPAIIKAQTQTGKTVISTDTILLQTQLIEKDLPQLATYFKNTFGFEIRYSLIKGKSNYICPLEVEEQVKAKTSISSNLKNFSLKVLDGKSSGDKSEISLSDADTKLWPVISAEGCIGTRCRHSKSCGYLRNKINTDAAQISVTNHAMTAAHLRLPNAHILGDVTTYILDEAHTFTDKIRDSFSDTTSIDAPSRLLKLTKKLSFVSSSRVVSLENVVNTIFSELPPITDAYTVLNTQNLAPQANRLLSAATYAGTIGIELDTPFKSGQVYDSDVIKLSGKALRASDHITNVYRLLYEISAGRCPDNQVAYIEYLGNEKRIVVAPIDTFPILSHKFNEKKVIAVSATIATINSNTKQMDLSSIKHDLGLADKSCEEKIVSSPFDYAKQSVLYVSNKGTQPHTVADEILRIAKITDGRTLALFTSWKDLESIEYIIKAKWNGALLAQSKNKSVPVGTLVEQFKSFAQKGRKPILMGNRSLWEGVSIEGDDLSSVIVVKLPFEPPNPISEAKKQKRGNDADFFSEELVPDMVKRLRQGCGRLIRTTNDVGLVAILDGRIITKSYGKAALNALPFVNVTTDIDRAGTAYKNLVENRNGRTTT